MQCVDAVGEGFNDIRSQGRGESGDVLILASDDYTRIGDDLDQLVLDCIGRHAGQDPTVYVCSRKLRQCVVRMTTSKARGYAPSASKSRRRFVGFDDICGVAVGGVRDPSAHCISQRSGLVFGALREVGAGGLIQAWLEAVRLKPV